MPHGQVCGKALNHGLMKLFDRHHPYGFAVLSLVLCAYLVKAFIPYGWMPAPSGEDAQGTPLVICTSNGLATILVDGSGQPVSDEGNNNAPVVPSVHKDKVCGFNIGAIAFGVINASNVFDAVVYERITHEPVIQALPKTFGRYASYISHAPPHSV